MTIDLDEILQSPAFGDLDRRFARFVAGRGIGREDLAGVAAAVASYQLRRGRVFLDLTRAPEWDNAEEAPVNDWPDLAFWREGLRKSPAVGSPGEAKPLLLTEGGKLYLQRYWLYEKRFAEKLRERSAVRADSLPVEVERRLEELFPEAPEQKAAARNAWMRGFSLISGGPGTGKTTTVLKILILFLEQNPELAIHLAAPTGKAAARLAESLRSGLGRIECPEAVRARLEAQEASTIHRVLGAVPGSVYFRHDANNPLPADLVILDEASMVDLPLMAKLFDALPSACRVVMLGDKDQLASVEAGSVLGGIVEAAIGEDAERRAPLEGAVTLLERNYRFGNESGIFRVCEAVRQGDPSATLEILRNDRAVGGDVAWRELPAPADLKEALRPVVLERFGEFVRKTDPGEALEAFGRFQILTALRQGPYGKESLNTLVEEILREEGVILPGRRNFPGRPLMVTENDYALRLFNGDLGVLLEDEERKLMAYFRNEDGSIRKVSPLRLPSAEPAFAMTVHKAQGSEFDEVLTIFPAHDSRILTRELVYTAISRARKRVEVWSGEDVLVAAVGRKVSRGSGLSEMLAAG